MVFGCLKLKEEERVERELTWDVFEYRERERELVLDLKPILGANL